ncbi:TetR/AcrR family transcriptional regulator [Colwellia psychrerythraea]|uniref:Transcriptional regulator, TetR family n=1 Tax=Colwellia psychrerythraea (strain 34H / ATCC BAA-681) TaxID=167879 RepID=Q482N3_COLP3|nr:TetR family transcriptional regulator [Colwellia psychrerythraea]AAZ25735.1 transcriptional regulator, TetR family [Colwellia psychrerythraea 34H]
MPVEDINTQKLAELNDKSPIKPRSKGEVTREKILIAAIEVLALNGIKGTTHRAIASNADLQLSLTTYYFKDIQELIHQAFRLNSERILSRTDTFLKAAFIVVTDIEKNELRKTIVKEKLCLQLSEMASEHLIDNIKHQAISLAVEQLMLTEIQVTPELCVLVKEHESVKLLPYEQLCQFFNKVNPELDAKIMYTVFSQLQYGQLTKQINIDSELIEQTTRRIIAWIMSIK